ncbi:hypothetical protein [Arthrobacter sp. AZCC_0090]|uniref:hypothetical protein n=1 Tax=Arthrobacter sp. AZCC_0090 TaxID=2735881 RepID=UPI0017A8160A|nr:hypothetical protein [Arthrobacter sp. AZCC_0090]MBB6402866.1 hypothetical protein [Arthrobacter sp. AZCC_0090]
MAAENMEPVEISTRFRPGEWTEASLAALTASYREKIRAMGAAPEDIVTHIDRGTNGSVAVSVSWDPGAGQAAANADATDLPTAGTSVTGSPEVARGFGEDIPPGEITEDAKGLGAVLGDADRSAIDEPPGDPRTIASSDEDEAMETFTRRTDEEGKPYLEDTEPGTTE